MRRLSPGTGSSHHPQDAVLPARQLWACQGVSCRAASSPSHPMCTAASVVLSWVQNFTCGHEELHFHEHPSAAAGIQGVTAAALPERELLTANAAAASPSCPRGDYSSSPSPSVSQLLFTSEVRESVT